MPCVIIITAISFTSVDERVIDRLLKNPAVLAEYQAGRRRLFAFSKRFVLKCVSKTILHIIIFSG